MSTSSAKGEYYIVKAPVNNLRIVLVVHNVRSAHNVGSLLRTADGLGVSKVYLTGYSPYPESRDDKRLPHLRARASKQIDKTALGAEKSIPWAHEEDINKVLRDLKAKKYLLVGLEQTDHSSPLDGLRAQQDVALIVGNEVLGLDEDTLKLVEAAVEIPMLGKKESLNVAAAAAIALYHLRFG